MRRKNATTDYLKECIADALIELMQTKPFDKITIEEITELAKVGRATYFRNFTSKSDVISFKIIRLWNSWAEEHNLNEESKYHLTISEPFFNFNYSIKDLHKIIYQANQQAAVYDAFQKIIVPPSNADAIELYRNRFLSYGFFGLLDEWIRRDYCEPPELMAQIVTERIVERKSRYTPPKAEQNSR